MNVYKATGNDCERGSCLCNYDKILRIRKISLDTLTKKHDLCENKERFTNNLMVYKSIMKAAFRQEKEITNGEVALWRGENIRTYSRIPRPKGLGVLSERTYTSINQGHR